MARSYAQLAALVFFIVGLGGLIAGQPGHGHLGNWADFDGVALHLTYVRDVLDLAIAAAFAFAGWRAGERDAALVVLAAGAFLLLLAVVGFIVSDDDLASRSVAALHFPLAINILDLIAGVLAVLCGLGGIEEAEAAAA
jgi:hypothetical protein